MSTGGKPPKTPLKGVPAEHEAASGGASPSKLRDDFLRQEPDEEKIPADEQDNAVPLAPADTIAVNNLNEDIEDEKANPAGRFGLSGLFNLAGNAWNSNKFTVGLLTGTTGLFAASLLMGTSFLTTPALMAGAVAAVGLMGLIKSSDIVASKAEAIGKRLGWNSTITGVVLGMVTSLPEVAVSMTGLLAGSPGIALGNAMGSNIANTGLILGVCAASKPLKSNDKHWWYHAGTMVMSTAFLGGNLLLGHLGMFSGVTLLGMLGAYAGGQFLLTKFGNKDKPEDAENENSQPEQAQQNAAQIQVAADEKPELTPEEKEAAKKAMWKDLLVGSAGVAALIGSASLLVTGGSAVALSIGVSQAVVAMLGFAIGTSLPELMVSIQSLRKGNAGMAVGNVIGSNIFNNLFVVGLTNAAAAFKGGITVPSDLGLGTLMGKVNMAAYGLSALLPAGFMAYNKATKGEDGSIGRWQGVALAGLYGTFAVAATVLGGAGGAQTAAAANDAATAAGTAAAVVPPVPA